MDLNKLESKLDDALSKETTESLTNWLNNKRMETLKAQELRIGNLVKLMLNHEDYEILSVETVDFIQIEKLQGEYEPILLTEEWLTKFGFVRINHQMSLNDGSMTYHYELNGHDRFWQLYFNGRAFSINEPKFRHHLYHNKYVHQLQNLYFALTGEELTIKN